MVPLGFYLVHRTTLFCGDVRLRSFRSRATRAAYPPFLQYEVFAVDGLYFVLNARGNLIVFQPIVGVSSIDEAQSFYDGASFDQVYKIAAKSAKFHFGVNQTDFDDSSLTWFGAPKTEISWRRTELRVNAIEHWPINIYIEALLIFSSCKSAEAILMTQLIKASNVATRSFINSSKDLILIEEPSDILVNEDEIALLKIFDEKWGIGRSVRSLQARFGQVISVLSLHASKVQGNHAMSLNLLVGCATILALLSVADPLRLMIGNGISTVVIQDGTVFASLLLGLAAIMRGRFRRSWEFASELIARRVMARRIRHLTRLPEEQASPLN